MKQTPMLFSAPMVRAILEDRKRRTRRIVKDPAEMGCLTGDCPHEAPLDCIKEITIYGATECPYGREMDRIWVREEFYQFGHWEAVVGAKTKGGRQKWKFVATKPDALYDAPASFRKGRHSKDPATDAWHKRLARFMPRSASRLTLEITGTRIERLQDISEEDAIKEGVDWKTCPITESTDSIVKGYGVRKIDYVGGFKKLWKSIHGSGSWDNNPYVWVIDFKKV